MPRSIYCGTIGLLLPNQRMIFNIPIRTIEYNHEEAVYGVGAGITIDSVPENEVQNFTIKLKFWSGYNMHLFETMKLDKGFIPRLDYHYQRISTSSEHLGFQFDHLFWKQFIHNIKTLHSKRRISFEGDVKQRR